MAILFLGIALFFGLHMIPYFGQALRTNLIGKIGALPYKGLFALASLCSFVVIVMGWQSVDVIQIYSPPVWGKHVTFLFVLIGIILFIASNAPTNIRRILRHPQLIGVTIWGIGHLFANGENRSVLLFGGFIIFSLVSIWATNRRDGVWVKRDKVSPISDIITVLIGIGVYGIFFTFHQNIIGVPVM
ncbi:NnrU family protein [Kordiimonas pumila]|uniref:NnrU family protein n=1 Tax=Kordiimonas pumila TaxID=2161677 RepID=A0ABV7D6X2_9PROT|nr:NnrU family protein [Kordiimonas pumila]